MKPIPVCLASLALAVAMSHGEIIQPVGVISEEYVFNSAAGPASTVTLLPVTDGDRDAANDMGGLNPAQGFALGALTGRYVKVSITDNYYGLQGMTGGGDRVGLGEIRFTTEEIPDFELDKAVLMVIHAHPDDEGIFFGGTLPFYSRVRCMPAVLVDMTTGWLNDDGTQTDDSETRETVLREAAW